MTDDASVAHDSLGTHLRQPRRLAAIVLLAITGGLIVAFNYARGENAGADALAYWAAVQHWLAGTDIYVTTIDPTQPTGQIMPYAYPPWTLVLFLPWALLPWEIAWDLWRWGGVLLFAWTVRWAYQRRPLGTALVIAILGPGIAANFDTGNVNIFIAVAIFAGQFVRARLGGLLWALSTALKWLPGLLIFVLPPRARAWGLAWLGLFTLLALATWPQTLKQIDIALFYPRPLRADYMMLAWAAIPWLWRQPWPPWWLQLRAILTRLRRPWPRFIDLVRAFFGRFRRPSHAETEQLVRLGELAGLSPDWVVGLEVADMEDGGMGSLRFRMPTTGQGKYPGHVVAEYRYLDADGVQVLVSLFADDNEDPLELDSWKVDFRPIISRSGPDVEDPIGRSGDLTLGSSDTSRPADRPD